MTMKTIQQFINEGDEFIVDLALFPFITAGEYAHVKTVLKTVYGAYLLYTSSSDYESAISAEEAQELVTGALFMRAYELAEMKKTLEVEYNLLERDNITTVSNRDKDNDSTVTSDTDSTSSGTSSNSGTTVGKVSAFDGGLVDNDSDTNTATANSSDTVNATSTVGTVAGEIENYTETRTGRAGADVERIIANRREIIDVSYIRMIALTILGAVSLGVVEY